jgi:PST family polysaccharide transporter
MLAAVIQRRDRVEEAANTAVLATFAGGLVLGVLGLAAAPVIGLIFDSRTIGLVAAAMAGLFVLSSGQIVPQALLQRRFSFLRRVVSDPLAVAVFGITAVVACAAGLGVWGLVLGSYASLLVEFTLMWVLAGWRPRPRRASLAMWRELIRYGRPVIASELAVHGTQSLQTLIIGRGVSTPALGQYGYAMRIAGQPYLALVNAASYVLFPTFAHIATDEERLRAAFVRSLRWMALLAFPLSLVLFALGEPIAVQLFGETWRPAGDVIRALCLFSAGHVLAGLAGELFKAVGRTDLVFRTQLLSAVLAVGLVLLAFPFGLVGIGAAVSVAAAGTLAYALRHVSAVLAVDARLLLREVWPPAAAAIVMAAATFVVEEAALEADERTPALGFALLAVEAILAGGVYLGALLVLAPARASELVGAVKSGVKRASTRLRLGGQEV